MATNTMEMNKLKFKYRSMLTILGALALRAVAREAMERKSGARGLRAILENLMLDVMYEIPSISGVKECIVSEEVVAQGKQPILVYENEAELA